MSVYCFFFSGTATTEIYTFCHTLSLHDALPIYPRPAGAEIEIERRGLGMPFFPLLQPGADRRILLDIMDAEFFEQRGVRVGEADEQIAAGIAMKIDLHRRDVGDVLFLAMDVFAADLYRARADIGSEPRRERVCHNV